MPPSFMYIYLLTVLVNRTGVSYSHWIGKRQSCGKVYVSGEGYGDGKRNFFGYGQGLG